MYLRALFLFSTLFTFFLSYSQQLFEGEINVSAGGGVDNRDAVIYLPAHYSKSKSYPLVIFTHGMGEAGKDVKKLYKQGLPKVLKSGYRPSFDFIMVAVQRNSFSVSPDWLAGILKDCQKRWKIDENRIYLTGLSAGGWAIYGSQLNYSAAFAKKFAAIVINSGVTQNVNKKNFDWWKQTKTPLWAIVGGSDKGYVGKNAYMVNEINKRVPKLATLTIRSGVGHGGWTDVYNGKVKINGKNMWEWLYQFSRSSKDTKPDNDEANNDDDDDKDKDKDKDKDDDEDDETTPPTDVSSAAATRYIKVNIFKGANPYTGSIWNNWDVGAQKATDINAGKFKYDDGASSAVSAVLSGSYRVVDNASAYGGGMAPAGVIRYTSYAIGKRTLTISGLSRSKKYNLNLYGSRRSRINRTTVYKINQTTRKIGTTNNLMDKASFTNLTPDAKGRIVVTIENLNTYNYINGFMITEIGTSKN